MTKRLGALSVSVSKREGVMIGWHWKWSITWRWLLHINKNKNNQRLGLHKLRNPPKDGSVVLNTKRIFACINFQENMRRDTK